MAYPVGYGALIRLVFEIREAFNRDLVKEEIVMAPPDSLHLVLTLKTPVHQFLIGSLHLIENARLKLVLNVFHLQFMTLHLFFVLALLE